MTSVAALILITFSILYFNNPDIIGEDAMISLMVPKASGLSLNTNHHDSSGGNYHEIQFKIDKSQFKKAPNFAEVTGYVNTNPLNISDLKGKVVLIHFWTYTCINCIHTIPYLNEWYQKYSDNEFVIASVHTPEFEFEKNIDNIKKAVGDFEIKYPVIQDNNYATWNAYNNNYWPRDYLIDKDGYIRYDHVGEGGYNQTEDMIRALITEPGNTVANNSSHTGIT